MAQKQKQSVVVGYTIDRVLNWFSGSDETRRQIRAEDATATYLCLYDERPETAECVPVTTARWTTNLRHARKASICVTQSNRRTGL